MKKKIIVLITIIGLAVLILISRGSKVEVNSSGSSSQSGQAPRPNPANATFSLDNGPVTLKEGLSEKSVSGSALVEETYLSDIFAYGDLNGDNKEDTALLLIQTSGGSGVFVYVASYVSGPVGYRGTNAIFLGDRIAPESLEIKNDMIIAKYLDRSPDEPFAAEPTVLVSKSYIYKSGELQER